MPSPDEIFQNWNGVIDNDFTQTILQTFDLPPEDKYIYRADSFAMPLSQIEVQTSQLKYKYQSHGQQIEVPPTDIAAYTCIFSPSTDTAKALTAFSSNAKKGSPRETVAKYLVSRRIFSAKVPKSRKHVNPYLDLWTHSCQLTSFLGPLPDASYAHPSNAQRTHPILPVFYHHFGCVVPTYEALYIISQLAGGPQGGVIDMASGNGYWTYMLRRMGTAVVAVDNAASEFRMEWVGNTVRADGVEYLRRNGGGAEKVLLLVYVVTKGSFMRRVVGAYKGDTIVVVGTQNANRYTGFSECTVEEWFDREMGGWDLTCRIAMPSFAGKDEAMFVWQRKK